MMQGTCYRAPLAAVAAALLSIAAPARSDEPARIAPSFDCSRATAPDEQAICSSDTLATLDRLSAEAFTSVAGAKGGAAAKAVARPALAARHACGTDEGCILRAQTTAIEGYTRLGAPLSPAPAVEGPPPSTPGGCSATTVASFGPRLDGADYDSGTGIAFANGGGQVSYDREEGIIASRPGDPVEMCLLSLPKDCPPGDDRGRWYLTRNLRTGAVWALPDAAHACGGA